MILLKKFVKYYKPYLNVFIFDLICATIISIVDLAYPQILRNLTRTLFTKNSDIIMSKLPIIAGILLAAYIVQALCKYYVSCQGHIMGAKMERDMRKELFDHYQALSFSYYDQNNTGRMMSRMVSDLFDISEMAHHGPENLFISVVKIIGSFFFLFRIQNKLASILLVVVVFMALFSFKQNKRMRATFADNRKKIGDINATLNDSFSGIRVVQAFANEELEREKFRIGNEAFLESKKDNYRAMGTFQGGNTFFQGFMYLLTLVAGGFFVAKGEMTSSDLAMYALYIGIFISPIQILVELTEMLQKGFSGFARFNEIMETESDIVDDNDAENFKNPEGDILFNNVSFCYKDDMENEVLSDVSFKVRSGESIAFVGPSGGGKTTICSLLPRFYDVTSGRITIGGQDIRKIKLSELRKYIGIVQQDVYLFDGTIRDNIAYGNPNATDKEIEDAAKKAHMDEFINSLPDGLDTLVGERGTRLSGGQKQRISIARIFLKNPAILLLDEATSALDNESEQYIQESLEELSKNRTTITIAHRLSTIRGAEEILVIDEGGIKERGCHEELMKKQGIYSKYYSLSVAR
ncbi:ABC transporter ATP-binding protein [Butyrivibrio sp. NC3005]|uniref:ABC transporter ATP-binding protein n=1 Tax=Butyrivibrio sp. NC3005 TaxID=1280685 RepID=UPI000416FE0D|nr:ABC transporter ATP-binding protein [Butyrivibrio sp. NC3005]